MTTDSRLCQDCSSHHLYELALTAVRYNIGQPELAVRFLEDALELNPGNAAARRLLMKAQARLPRQK